MRPYFSYPSKIISQDPKNRTLLPVDPTTFYHFSFSFFSFLFLPPSRRCPTAAGRPLHTAHCPVELAGVRSPGMKRKEAEFEPHSAPCPHRSTGGSMHNKCFVHSPSVAASLNEAAKAQFRATTSSTLCARSSLADREEGANAGGEQGTEGD